MCGSPALERLCWASLVWDEPANPSCLSQALPYVALLIAMLFFIYAVIGMQVSRSCLSLAEPLARRPRVCT